MKLPGEADSYTIRCAMGHEPTEDNHTVEVHIVEELNILKNELNTTIKYDNVTGGLKAGFPILPSLLNIILQNLYVTYSSIDSTQTLLLHAIYYHDHILQHLEPCN